MMKFSILLIICSIVSSSFAQYYYNRPKVEFYTGIKPTIPTVHPPPIKSKSHGYVYPKPEIPFTLPGERYQYPKPNQQLALPNQKPTSPNLNIPPTKIPKVVTIAPKLNPATTLQPNRGYEYPTPSIPLKKEGGYQYPKPVIIFPVSKPIPTLAKVVTRISNLNPTTTAAKANRRYEYPTPSTPLKKEGGYQYPKPLIPFPVPKPLPTSAEIAKVITRVTKLNPTTNTTNANRGYEYPKPSTPFKKEGGYQYPNPFIPFPVPKPLPTSTETPKVVTRVTKLNPTTTTPKLIQNKQSGYQYSKPHIAFPVPKPQPTTTKATKIVTITPKLNPTTSKPKPNLGYKYPTPSTPFKKESGYQYLKPIIPFPVPKPLPKSTEAPKVFTRVTKLNPTTTTPKLFQKESGYKYPKPLIPFPVPKPLPTATNAPKIVTITTKLNTKTTTSKPQRDHKHPKPVVPSKTESGNQYPKPLIPFPIPNPLPTIVSKTLKPNTTLQPTIPHSKGYVYPIPKNPLIIPTKVPQLKIVTTTRGFEYPKPSKAYNILKTTTKTPTSLSGYYYPKPIIPFEPERMNEIPRGYKYPKPSVQFES